MTDDAEWTRLHLLALHAEIRQLRQAGDRAVELLAAGHHYEAEWHLRHNLTDYERNRPRVAVNQASDRLHAQGLAENEERDMRAASRQDAVDKR